ncbi:MAG: tRNA (guanosine(37)-N1)-methyltransferase TrmD [Bacteroidota bacterium]
MRIDIVTAIPELLKSFIENSIVNIAREKGLAEIITHNLHDYADNKYRHIDDYPFGGGAGMIIQCDPVFKCIEGLQRYREYRAVIYMTADGTPLKQEMCNEFSLMDNIIILAGHYKGVDQRIRDSLITHEISIGDYVLSGGELPAAIMMDSIIRLIPGVLGDAGSALEDSFQDGLLEPPQYTRPAEYKGMKVPDILLSGDHKRINEWRREISFEKTKQIRPDLLKD